MQTLIDELLRDQSVLQTPVAEFARLHAQPPPAERFRSLIPLTAPQPGEQYAFEVSLDRCTGCKSCVSACHSLNGLDEDETWRDTGLLLGGGEAPSWQQTITTACHHCEEPGCLLGCPVAAYEKSPATGIVRHLDDQCIGCSYCILKCPYDVPKFSKSRGIVRKCDMCHQRLAVGEAPACVQACPTEAIRIVKVPSTPGAQIQRLPSAASWFSAGTSTSAIPDAGITRPATRYIGRPVPGTAHAADREALHPQHTHWPLVWMLVLTQAGIGLMLGCFGQQNPPPSLLAAACGCFYLGMLASVLHLGQPLKAWRFFLGLKTSWLSREILAFSMLAPWPLLWCLAETLPGLWPLLPAAGWLHTVLPVLFICTALPAVFTSVMIYHDTRRPGWHFRFTAPRFFGTTAAFAAFAMFMQPSPSAALPNLIAVWTAVAIVLGKLLLESAQLRHATAALWSPHQHTARLLLGPLRIPLRMRFLLMFLAVAFLMVPYELAHWLAFFLLIASEIAERRLFFQSIHAPKMPGLPLA